MITLSMAGYSLSLRSLSAAQSKAAIKVTAIIESEMAAWLVDELVTVFGELLQGKHGRQVRDQR